MTQPIERPVIVIATYLRPHELDSALLALEAQDYPGRFRIVVVDNDPAGSARGRVQRGLRVPAEYLIEPQPGIANVRNASLDAVRDSDDAVVFVDDDEVFDRDWLSRLIAAADEYAADIVGGPVITEYPPETPRWIRAGSFVQRSRMPTGVLRGKFPATNNVLVRTAYWRAAGSPQFDTAFGLTGGSDSDFFSRLITPGDRVYWCDEAIVRESLPPERRSFRWVMRRMIRTANVEGRILLRVRSRPRLVAGAIGRIGYGLILTATSVVVGRGFRKQDVKYVTLGIGWLGAVTNRLIVEYKRADA